MPNAAPARALRLRVTRADACGVPATETDPMRSVTTVGFVTVGLSADVFTSSDIQVAGADGSICVRSKGVPSLLGYNVNITLCNFNLAALEILLGIGILDDGGGTPRDIGGVLTADGSFNDRTAIVEWWPQNANTDACGAGGNAYLHYLLPRTNRWVVSGNTDFGDAASTITLSGYADPTVSFASVVTGDWSAAQETAINANGVLAWKETATLPVSVTEGYDATLL